MLMTPYQMLDTMLCKLYGLVDSSLFGLSQVPLMSVIFEKGFIFNWVKILSSNLTQEIRACREAPQDKPTRFLMSNYLFDMVCAFLHFQAMNIHWTIAHAPVHIYFCQLWVSRFKHFLYDICDKVMSPLHTFLCMHAPPQFLEEGCRALQGIGDQYVKKHHYYIQIYGLDDAPHFLPVFVPEVSYQIGVRGIASSVIGSCKKVWPTFPIKIGHYVLHNVTHAKVEVHGLETKFNEGIISTT